MDVGRKRQNHFVPASPIFCVLMKNLVLPIIHSIDCVHKILLDLFLSKEKLVGILRLFLCCVFRTQYNLFVPIKYGGVPAD